jgi:signal transduction histidine kinase
MEGYRASGFRRPLPADAAAPAGTGDEIDQIASAFQEMSERITAQMVELERTDRLRRELVANVSHDLRTPLASLHGYLETLAVKQGRLTPEEEREYLAIATRHSERLGKLVSELFELTKLDASDTELTVERFSLAELVQDVVQDFRLRAEEREVALSVSLDRASGLVEADIRLVERALVNLVENALKFTPGGGRVTVSVEGREAKLRVEVRDTGCGIREAELPFIFERFYRTEKGREDGGSGLGLAIAKRILELHGSRIEVASALGEGTSFRFEMAEVETA